MTYLEKFVALLTQRQGMTARELCLGVGHRITSGSREISRLTMLGKLTAIRVTPVSRYFTSPQELELMRDQIAADVAEHAALCKMRRAEINRKSNDKQAVKYRAMVAKNPPKVKQAKPAKANKLAKPETVLRIAGSSIRAESPPKRGPAYSDGPMVITAETRRIVCPSPPRHLWSNTYS